MSSFLSRTNTDGGEKVTPSEAESKKEVNPDCERNAFYTSKFKSLPSEFLCKITKAHVEVAQWRLGRADPGTRPPWWPESVDYADVDKLSEESMKSTDHFFFFFNVLDWPRMYADWQQVASSLTPTYFPTLGLKERSSRAHLNECRKYPTNAKP
ncbi:hypothetical protein BDDG_01533 [Blastomyces dermatitidis ATCC 18188]|uniref:Uncharacterized protein n=1 Tax=Ajellomyces dermatitidis (strain ATCC 18188 / CBS 674.68) TaxID=653446 RepID=F2T5T3_AJEDA|nr:hypothetical protein BDDG_01533 [Blastomyces dermatitidis ATCC 18188]